jgi:hypothetical protein
MSWIHVVLILLSSIGKLCFDNSSLKIWLIEEEDSTKFFPLAMVFVASPYFIEICGYEGHIYMTLSSKASSQ